MCGSVVAAVAIVVVRLVELLIIKNVMFCALSDTSMKLDTQYVYIIRVISRRCQRSNPMWLSLIIFTNCIPKVTSVLIFG